MKLNKYPDDEVQTIIQGEGGGFDYFWMVSKAGTADVSAISSFTAQ